MPATVHFAPALANGGLILGRTQVVTQATGLVEVSAQYIARQADLPRVVDRFFLDAAPPIFPEASISARTLQQGALFMVNYSVAQEYGIATITARYAGVSNKPIVPFRTFEYVSFTQRVAFNASTTGAFGAGRNFRNSFLAEPNNEYLTFPVATVDLSGRVEQTKFTFASLATSPEADLPPRPTLAEGIAELSSGRVRPRDEPRKFGGEWRETSDPTNDVQPGESYSSVTELIAPPNVAPSQVLSFLAQQNGLNDLSDLTPEAWADRGVVPSGYFSIARRTQAITPSVYIREITYVPRISSGS